ncbi:Calx-beta domain-containing protein [Thalassoroseus pseudoceratinae]|uniref:Calx-beta domain-containing protein n=1 Tax=Thalassoroseus pseudoceratinae TaxID=2713176 RepID=UPI00142269EE|nr:Calx-beta domain-containing protein [Thalassoroseus pseudoceratinae]
MRRFRWLNRIVSRAVDARPLERRVRRRRVGYERLIAAEVLEDRTLLAGFVDPNPSDGNRFGESVLVLSNGNVVVTAPGDDAGGTDAGAVYLFDGETGDVISTLLGADDFDRIGQVGGLGDPDVSLFEVGNSNFIILSPSVDRNGQINAGAVTFGDGETGVSGVVSPQNSLVGSAVGDNVGFDVFILSNGNYLVRSPFWDRGGIEDAGALTFGDGITGVAGIVTENNSLIGSTADDEVGFGSIIELPTTGNFVVQSTSWQNDQGDTVEAITFGDGDLGGTGSISSENSLVGTAANRLGDIITLANGNYLVEDAFWDNGSTNSVGAVTFGSGTTGVVGTVSAANSLIGNSENDFVGEKIFPLSNGNYVVVSDGWDSATHSSVGAVTFGGPNGVTGLVSQSNSFVGRDSVDLVGSGGIVELANGNYVIVSPSVDIGSDFGNGAVTFASGTSGIVGQVSETNSLIGGQSSDAIGSGGVMPLSNGNYVVASPDWNGERGAITLGDGTNGTEGVVSAANSLVGANEADRVGDGEILDLSNGNYIAASPNFQHDGALRAGAVTFGSASVPLKGVLDSTNSLVGSTLDDRVGENIFALSNGDYVVAVPTWDDSSTVDVGAVTVGDGANGTVGVISSSNSLVGSTAGDMVGQHIQPLSTGNFIALSPSWDSGSIADVGAVTFIDSNSPAIGPITVGNSLVGASANDRIGVGLDNIALLSNGNYLVLSPNWDNSGEADAGAVTFGSGTTGVSGVVGESNSLVGSTANDRVGLVNTNVVELTNGNFVLRTSRWDNAGIVDAGAVTFGSGTAGITGAISESNSLVGSSTRDELGKNIDSVVPLPDGNYVVRSSAWDNGNIADAGAATYGDGTMGVKGEITQFNSLVGSSPQDQVGEGVVSIGNGAYVVLSRGYDDGTNIDIGAATFGQAGVGVSGTIDAANSVFGEGTSRDLLVFVLDLPAPAPSASATASETSNNGSQKKFLVSFFDDDGTSFLREGSGTSGFTLARLNIGDAIAVVEGDSGMTEITFLVTLDQALDQDVFFDINAVAGTADASDFVNDVLFTVGDNGTIAAGSDERKITLQVRGDQITELDEEFFIVLSNFNFNSQNVTVAGFQGKGTIENDDASTFTITSETGNEDDGNLTFEISLDHPVDVETRVSYATDLTGQTASANDFTEVTDELIFSAGAVPKSITISPTADDLTELDETFLVRLSNLVANGRDVSIDVEPGVGTIKNDDAAQISINDVEVDEDAGNVKFIVSLGQDQAVDTDISVDFATASGSATAGDFTATNGTLDIPAGMTSGEIIIPIADDMTVEDDEEFVVNLSNLEAAERLVSISKSQGTATISDNDVTVLSITDRDVDEDQQTMTFQATLTKPLDVDLTFDAATEIGTAELEDFTPISDTFRIDAGQTSVDIVVSITQDSIVEQTEHFSLNLENVSASGRQVLLGNLQATGEIRDDDSARLSISDELEIEDEGTITFQVTLDNAVEGEVTVDFQTSSISASSNDYSSTSGQLTFEANETKKTIVVDVSADDLVEGNEQFEVILSNLQPQGLDVSLVGDRGVGTIRNDDEALLTIANESEAELAENMTFTVSLSNLIDQSVTVDYVTEAGTASEQDFVPVSGTLTIPANTQNMTFDVEILRDGIAEGDEQFAVQLSNMQAGGRNASIGDSRAIGTILDGGTDARVSISELSGSEDDGVMTWAVQIDQALDVDVNIDYQTSFDTANNNDFVSTSGTLTIVAGQTSADFQVSITDDSIVETTERYLVQLSNINVQNRRVVFEEDQAFGLIQDDDSATVRIGDSFEFENNGEITFTIEISEVSDADVTIDYSTVFDTASSSDIVAVADMATIPAGSLSTLISVTLVNDELLEADEQFYLQLANLQAGGRNIQLTDDRGTGTIRSEDSGLVGIADASTLEDAGPLVFVVTLDHASEEAINVGYQTELITADQNDASLLSGTLTIPAGQQSARITFDIANDSVVEADELVAVNLVSVSAHGGTVQIIDDRAVGTIRNDDSATLRILDGSGNEDEGAIEFTIELDEVVDHELTVNFATLAGTASENDFSPLTGTVTIPAGERDTAVRIASIADTTFELDEQFSLELSELQAAGRNVSISDSRGIGTIRNDDTVEVSVADVAQTERLPRLKFSVQINTPLEVDLVIPYATANQTAGANDFTPLSGTLTIPAGLTFAEVEVDVTSDEFIESDETFQFILDPNNNSSEQVIFVNAVATGTIIDDDIIDDDIIDDDITDIHDNNVEVRNSYLNPSVINGIFEVVLTGNFDQVGNGDDDLLFWDPDSGKTRLVFGTGEFQDNPIAPNSINGNDFFEAIVGDFDGSGGDDLFFWNPFTGKNRLFHTNSQNSRVSTTFETNIISPTEINGNDFQQFVVADFDGGGPEDLFFWSPLSGRNRLVHIDVVQAGLESRGGNVQNNIVNHTLLNGGDFETVHAGQFDGDGIFELLFFNLSTGRNRIITFDLVAAGVESVFSGQVTNNLDPRAFNGSIYEKIELADLNGDGIDDVFSWRPGPGDNRVGLVNLTPNSSGQIRTNFIPRNSINGEFSHLVRLTDQLFSSEFRDELFFWDPRTGNNRVSHL